MKKRKILSATLILAFCLSVLFTPLSSGGWEAPPFPGGGDDADTFIGNF